MTINNQAFGTTPTGNNATLWTIENSSGLSLSLCDWGATIVSVKQPDKNGVSEEITLGFKEASRYVSSEGYLGATCGRFAGRIALGKFTLKNKIYELVCNDESNHLHGGERGYNARSWEVSPYSEGDRSGVVFSLTSPDGEENYPGELQVKADYSLDESGRLYMEFYGETDKTTIINITNHAYWNLGGRSSGSVLDHIIKIYASSYLPIDETSNPTGEIRSVKGTAFDFLTDRPISEEYDHCMVIDGENGDLRIAVEVREPKSGRKLILYTDRPGVQLYTGNYLQGKPFPRNGGFCLEPQDFPDAPNQAEFPSVVLHPGETYHHRSMIEFSNS